MIVTNKVFVINVGAYSTRPLRSEMLSMRLRRQQKNYLFLQMNCYPCESLRFHSCKYDDCRHIHRQWGHLYLFTKINGATSPKLV